MKGSWDMSKEAKNRLRVVLNEIGSLLNDHKKNHDKIINGIQWLVDYIQPEAIQELKNEVENGETIHSLTTDDYFSNKQSVLN